MAYRIQLASAKTCTGCSACASICPTKSITMIEDKEGFLQPYIDTDTCIKCHKCEKTCPVISPITIPTDFETQAFAAINKDEAVRMRSSSGGMFHALAKWTIEQDGVVFGARFNENWEVVHDYTETLEGIDPFMRSKYVQSRIGDTFKQAMQFLERGRQVLFVGTPCQVGGLRSFLNKDYDNLLAVDLICHGVPSPKVWREYLKWKAKGDDVVDINFRDKKEGWKEFQCVTTTIATTMREHQRENIYFRGFLENVYLRKSCYACRFKHLHRASDMTMADFWGIQNFCPEMDDNKGTSGIFIHSSNGARVVKHLSMGLRLMNQKQESVIACNSMMTESVALPNQRKRFFLYFRWFPFEITKFAIDKDWIINRIYSKFKKTIYKVYKHLCKGK